jgi:hypothetical protein
MRRKERAKKPNRQKIRLGLTDLEHVKPAVLVSLRSPESQRSYRRSLDDFVCWYCSEARLSFNKAVVTRYRIHLEDKLLAPGTINVRLGNWLTVDEAGPNFQWLNQAQLWFSKIDRDVIARGV